MTDKPFASARTMLPRRMVFAGAAGLAYSGGVLKASAATGFAAIPMATHERSMRLAIEQANRNPRFPFGAVIVSAKDGAMLAQGVNDAWHNPTLHGEIACINDYVAKHGNTGWIDAILYTTAEPCAMCMSALVWSGIGGVVYASSLQTVDRWSGGKYGINIRAQAVVDASHGYPGSLLGGVLQDETDRLFSHKLHD